MLPQLKPIDACGYTPCNFQFVARVLDIEYPIAAQLYMFSLQLLRHSLRGQ